MSLKQLLDKQKKLDIEILKNEFERQEINLTKENIRKIYYKMNEELLTKTLLALQVEIAELANETRCFKHWSTKGLKQADIKEVKEEFIDVLHFFLSVANQLDLSAEDIMQEYDRKNEINYKRQQNDY